MPRLPRIRVPLLAQIASGQRYTPAPAALRTIARIELLAAELEPDRLYTDAEIVDRITGYRPTATEDNKLPGEALLADLSPLAERLAAHARIGVDSLPPGCLDRPALAERWNVSTRTVERDRRRGLIARRVQDPRAGAKLYFTPHVVEAFERSHPERSPTVADRSRHPRLNDAERARILEQAMRYRRALGWGITRVCDRLAQRFNRHPSTIRRTLVRNDDARAAFGLRPPLTARDRRRLLRAFERGTAPRALVRRSGRSRAGVRRMVSGERARRLRTLAPLPHHSPAGDASSATLEHNAARHDLTMSIERDPRRWIETARAMPPQPLDAERARAEAALALRARAASIARMLTRRDPSAVLLDRAETDLRWAARLRTTLALHTSPVVLRAIEERLARPLSDLPAELAQPLIDLALGALGGPNGALARHDPTRGGRLAAPVGLAVSRALASTEGRELLDRAARHHAPARAHRPGTFPLDDWAFGPSGVGWFARTLVPQRLSNAPAPTLDHDAATALRLRFGLDGSHPRTLAEVAGALNLATATTARHLRRALRTHHARGPG
jgi:hypothetical protein